MNGTRVCVSISDPWDLAEALGWPMSRGSIIAMAANEGHEAALIELDVPIQHGSGNWRFLVASARYVGQHVADILETGIVACGVMSIADHDAGSQRWSRADAFKRAGLSFIGSISLWTREREQELILRERNQPMKPPSDAKTSAGKRPSTLAPLFPDFEEAVRALLEPVLRRHRFSPLIRVQYGVKFESSSVEVLLYYAPYSHEMDTYVTRLANPKEKHDLQSVVDAAGGSETASFAASTPERIIEGVASIAELLERYGGDVLRGSEAAFQRVADAAARRNAAYWHEEQDRPIRTAAEAAWRSKDYEEVKRLYLSFAGELSIVERKRLDYASKHVAR